MTEIDPTNYKRLRHNRPAAINIHAGLCSESAALHFSDKSILPMRGLVELMKPSYLQQWHSKVYSQQISLASLPRVSCVLPSSLFRALGLQHVAIWILDAEGAEESILRGVDFNSVMFDAIVVDRSEDEEGNQRIERLLEGNGFACEIFQDNWMCRRKDFTPHSAPPSSTQQ